MNTIEQEYLFVYGTLGRATHPNNAPHHMHSILTTFATYVSRAVFCGRMYYVAQYPGVVESGAAEDKVIGEVYALTTNPQRNDLLWKILDEYEGNDGTEYALYIRKKTSVVLLDRGTTLETWVYLYNRSVEALERIVTGDFSQPFVG